MAKIAVSQMIAFLVCQGPQQICYIVGFFHVFRQVSSPEQAHPQPRLTQWHSLRKALIVNGVHESIIYFTVQLGVIKLVSGRLKLIVVRRDILLHTDV